MRPNDTFHPAQIPTRSYDAKVWAMIGLLSFGGPAGQIALMHRRIVDELKWISEAQFLSALNFCMLLPGPEAQQLATYIGWHRAGWRGALVAGWLFLLPGVVVMFALCWAYVGAIHLPYVMTAFLGIKCAVIAILLQALIRISRRALRIRGTLIIAVLGFISVHLLAVPYPLIVMTAGVTGFVSAMGAPREVIATDAAPPSRAALDVRLILTTFLAWVAPTALLLWLLGFDHVLTQIALFFSHLAVVTFGGAYAVLGYAADHAVQNGWLTVREMTDGLGLAETTPGPLILVLQFIAFLAGKGDAPLSVSWPMATLASLLAVWSLFLPSFLWIFLGGPFITRINAHPGLQRSMAYISAAVVGVILNVSIWYTLHVMFGSVQSTRVGALHWYAIDAASIQWACLVPTAVAFISLFLLRRGIGVTLLLAALTSLLLGS
jgi:chromate transporter